MEKQFSRESDEAYLVRLGGEVLRLTKELAMRKSEFVELQMKVVKRGTGESEAM